MADGQQSAVSMFCTTAIGVYSFNRDDGYIYGWSPPYRVKRPSWPNESLLPPPPPPVPFCWGPNGCLILLGYMLTVYAAAVTLAMMVGAING